jgi:hypothetical protein
MKDPGVLEVHFWLTIVSLCFWRIVNFVVKRDLITDSTMASKKPIEKRNIHDSHSSRFSDGFSSINFNSRYTPVILNPLRTQLGNH